VKEETNVNRMERQSLMDTANVLKIRLNTDYVLERVRIFLTGKIQYVLYDENSKPYTEEKQISDKKANDKGIQNILNYVENAINPQVVQGNFEKEMFYNYIDEFHIGLIQNLANNLYNWEISEDDYEPIIDTIMILVIPFISRLIDNEERSSYAQSLKSFEGSATHTGKEGLIR